MSKDVELGWYAGSNELDLQKIIPLVFEKIFSRAQPSRKIFAGGSNGGFAAMYYSRFFPDSLAIASNPQTDICKYWPNPVKRYADVAFNLKNKDDLSKYINTDLGALYSSDRENFILYLQNISDAFHVKEHCAPFLEKLGHTCRLDEIKKEKIDDRLFIHVEKWGDGHIGASKVYWKVLLNNLITQPLGWGDIFANDGIKYIVERTMEKVRMDRIGSKES